LETRSARTFYRIVSADPPKERDFWSHQQLGRVLRDPSPRSRDQWSGVSVYDNESDAVNLIRQFPRIGQWIAEVRIDAQLAIRIEKTGSKQDSHHTIWADGGTLLSCVVAVRPVAQGDRR